VATISNNGKEMIEAYPRHYSSIHLDGLKQTIYDLS